MEAGNCSGSASDISQRNNAVQRFCVISPVEINITFYGFRTTVPRQCPSGKEDNPAVEEIRLFPRWRLFTFMSKFLYITVASYIKTRTKRLTMKISCNRILKYGYSRLSGYQQAGYGS
jgi:hypothetical protein